MNPARRRAAAALVLGALAGSFAMAFTAPTAGAAPQLWDTDGSSWDPSIADGMTMSGATATFSGTFVYDDSDEPRPASITDVDLTLHRIEESGTCPTDQTVSVHVRDGDPVLGEPPITPTTPSTPTTNGPTSTTALPTTTTVPESASTYHFVFDFVPACNGMFDVDAVATVDRDFQHRSPTLHLDNVVLDLHPPTVPGVTATLNADKSSTVNWSAPAGYAAPGAPVDFVGYSVQRSVGDGDWANLASVEPAVLTLHDPLTGAQPGIYRYRVFAVRSGATGAFITSGADSAVVAQVSIGGTPAPATTARPSATTPARGGGPVATVATSTTDPGFSSTLPFDPNADLIFGPEDPVLPDDASGLLDIDSGDDAGAGLAVPFAVGLVIVVWALHLRLLTHRATEPS